VIDKIIRWVTDNFCGSGDPEKHDATHIAAYLKQNFTDGDLKAIFKGFRDRLEVLDPKWRFRRMGIVDTVVAPAEPGDEAASFQIAPWQIGFRMTDSLKVGVS